MDCCLKTKTLDHDDVGYVVGIAGDDDRRTHHYHTRHVSLTFAHGNNVESLEPLGGYYSWEKYVLHQL